MRGIVATCLMTLALLAGCAVGSADAPGDATEITQTPLDAPDMPQTPSETRPEPAAEPIPEPTPPVPPLLASQRAACIAGGGQMTTRAPGIFACVQPTRDGGQSCDAASDCEGLCLARSGSCAPLAPLYGCQEVYTTPGRRETLCTR